MSRKSRDQRIIELMMASSVEDVRRYLDMAKAILSQRLPKAKTMAAPKVEVSK